MTPSMVEALGVLGTEGSFRKYCELAMRLLYHRKNVLVSYIRPFAFDQLFRYKKGGEKAVLADELTYKRRRTDINDMMRKLDGYPRKYRKFLEIALSPEGHVKFVIDEATSQANLSQMYFYWAPYA